MALHSHIIGTGSYLPAKILTNDDLAKIVDTSDEWIFSRTGMRERHVAGPSEKTSDLAIAASVQALDSCGLKGSDIDLIIVATSTPDNTFPATACRVQAALESTAAAFDMQAVCSGFVYALTVADSMLKSGSYKRALVIGAECMSRLLDWTDRGTCVLFGDGAGAVVLEASELAGGILASEICTDGRAFDLLKTTGGVGTDGSIGKMYMDGQGVFKLAVVKMPEVSKSCVARAGITLADIDWFIPHQANIRIIDSAMKHLEIAKEKVIITIDKTANTSAASIPLSLDVAVRDGRVKKGDKVLLTAMGAGFTWGSVVFEY